MNIIPLGPEAWYRKYWDKARISFGVETESLHLTEILSSEEIITLGERISQCDLAFSL